MSRSSGKKKSANFVDNISEQHRLNKQQKQFTSKSERVDAQMRMWIAYWRCNLHRFAEDMGVRLHLFQKLILFVMDYFPNFM